MVEDIKPLLTICAIFICLLLLYGLGWILFGIDLIKEMIKNIKKGIK